MPLTESGFDGQRSSYTLRPPRPDVYTLYTHWHAVCSCSNGRGLLHIRDQDQCPHFPEGIPILERLGFQVGCLVCKTCPGFPRSWWAWNVLLVLREKKLGKTSEVSGVPAVSQPAPVQGLQSKKCLYLVWWRVARDFMILPSGEASLAVFESSRIQGFGTAAETGV